MGGLVMVLVAEVLMDTEEALMDMEAVTDMAATTMKVAQAMVMAEVITMVACLAMVPATDPITAAGLCMVEVDMVVAIYMVAQVDIVVGMVVMAVAGGATVTGTTPMASEILFQTTEEIISVTSEVIIHVDFPDH
ncbi:hypothetical protein BHE74_00021724 [Ensete ventricosum]|nr:hypothetical protein GW17_00043496 [Ensete ventricosum]RWW70588.1 hypothetical protein BHE74_00021724 [Ensete ventricosum]RZS20386.1 hypothetical protein BHM03_00052886 [Ensete ventricosum]